MKFGANHLSYCTNVHPAETFDELIETLQTDVRKVKQAVAPGQPFGVGLRLSAQMVLSMTNSKKQRLLRTLDHENMYVFSVNGFPYGDFGVGVVKAAVYEPAWDDIRRVKYTIAIADLLVQLPGPQTRSISTVALGNRLRFEDKSRISQAVTHLEHVCRHLEDLHRKTGIFVDLCLEPEPATFLETSLDVISFFTDHGFAGSRGPKRHVSICYDTCHQAVMFEDSQHCLRTLSDAKIRIGKMQISNAIVLDDPMNAQKRKALLDFDEPRFLHQVVADEGNLFALDLSEVAQPSTAWERAAQWRCHFHVPLHWTGSLGLSSTTTDWQSALQYAIEQQLCTHFEIETYTWHVLPDHAGSTAEVLEGIEAEFSVVKPYFEGL